MKDREYRKVERSTLVIVASFTLVVGYFTGTRSYDIQNIFRPFFGQKKVETLDLTKVQNTYKTLSSKFDGSLDTNKLIEGASKGLVESAGDKFTEYMDSSEAEEFNKALNGDVGAGIGVEVGKRNNLPTVLRVLKNNSAEKSGVKVNDIIIAVNDEDVTTKSITDVTQLIRGEAGTTVKIKMKRGSEDKEFSIMRAKIDNPSVEYSTSGNTGILTISRFDSETASLARKYAENIKSSGISNVILDLRGNGGGLVTAAQAVASLWVDKNYTIVTEKRGSTVVDDIKASGNNILKGYKTVVLVNGSSASASEIVTGALKDHKLATIVGEKTYGKGSVQEPIEINGGSILKVTVAKWYTPNNKNIHGEGIAPDQEVKISNEDFNSGKDTQLEKAKEILK